MDMENYIEEQAETADFEDHSFDNLDDAAEALGDDFDTDDEEPDTDEGDAEDAVDEDQEDEGETEEDQESEDGEDSDDDFVEIGGEKVALEELKNGYFRQQDYTKKTEQLAEERKSVEKMRQDYVGHVQAVQSSHQSVMNFLNQMVPPEPSIDLSVSNPQAYQQQKAIRENAIREINGLLQQSNQVKAGKEQFDQSEQERYNQEFKQSLKGYFPQLNDDASLNAFNTEKATAAKEFGFSEQEYSSCMDARIVNLLHYAQIGKRAETNKAGLQKRTANKAIKGRKGRANNAPTTKSNKALSILKKTGSLDAAALVDFD